MNPAAHATTARTLAPTLTAASVLFAGGIVGFFYAWICSTMWGLDAAGPRVDIAAMQAMNVSVRNAVFSPIFFGTVLVLFLAAAVARAAGQHRPSLLLAAGGAVSRVPKQRPADFGPVFLAAMVNLKAWLDGEEPPRRQGGGQGHGRPGPARPDRPGR